MELIDYSIDTFNQCVTLFYDNGNSVKVNLNQDSGNIYKRPKINSVYNIDHKGIYVGYSEYGEQIMVHNHYLPGRAVVTTWEGFLQNQTFELDQKVCTNDPITRIAIALQMVLDRTQYDLLTHSCQTLVNESCTNEKKNDDTEKVLGGLALTALLIAGIAALANSK